MAIKASLRIIARRISQAIGRAAANQGLVENDYALAGTYYEDSDRIGLRIGTDHPVDDRRLYADAMKEIRHAFPDYPSITYFVSLVIYKVQNLDEIYWNLSDSEDAEDMSELLNGSRR